MRNLFRMSPIAVAAFVTFGRASLAHLVGSGGGAQRRRVLTFAIVVMAASSLTGVSVATAATPNYRPDGRILQPCDPQYEDCQPTWFGNNIYNTEPTGQRAEYFDQQGVSYDGPVIFRIRIQNDGARADRFRVLATGSTSGYGVRFFRGTTDITSAVKAGTYRTPTLSPGAYDSIRARVVLRSDAVNGDQAVRLVTLTSMGNTNRKDAIKFVRHFSSCGC